MQALSAELDRVMAAPARITESEQIRRYRELMTGDTDWAWKRVHAHIREFTEALEAAPPIPPRAISARLDHATGATARPRRDAVTEQLQFSFEVKSLTDQLGDPCAYGKTGARRLLTALIRAGLAPEGMRPAAALVLGLDREAARLNESEPTA